MKKIKDFLTNTIELPVWQVSFLCALVIVDTAIAFIISLRLQ